MSQMIELHDVDDLWSHALNRFQTAVENSRREFAARVLSMYPHKDRLEEIARVLRRDLATHEVEVNSIREDEQVTIAKAPAEAINAHIAKKDSLCVFSVGIGENIEVSDVAHDPFLRGHSVQRSKIGSYASSPLIILGSEAGSVCTLEMERARSWSPLEEQRIEQSAREIERLVNHWYDHVNKGIFL